MSNNLIVNTASSHFLGVDSHWPQSGDQVNLYQINAGKRISAYWLIKNVEGGQIITLQNNPALRLGFDANASRTSGVLLFVYDHDTNGNTLWATEDLPLITSLAGADPEGRSLVIDSDGRDGRPQLWHSLGNDHQKWGVTSIEA